MPQPDALLLFVTAGLLLNITPGPDVLYIVGRSLGQGRSAGVLSALGIAAGCLVHVAAAALGLSAIMSAARPSTTESGMPVPRTSSGSACGRCGPAAPRWRFAKTGRRDGARSSARAW